MNPVNVHLCNTIFAAPAGSETEIEPLPVLAERYADGSVSLTSFWVPTPEEITQIVNGQPIMLSVLDTKHPPVKMAVANAVLSTDASNPERS